MRYFLIKRVLDKYNMITKNSKITLIELPPTLFGKLNGDISYDIYTKFKLPSRALHVLEGVIRHDGFTDVMTMNPLYHGKKNKLTKENFSRIFKSDVLCLSSITRTSAQTIKLADIYKKNNPEGIIIAGGPDPTFRYIEWLEHVDIIVYGEGEKTFSELMEQLTKDPDRLEKIDGLIYKKKGKIVNTKPRRLLSAEELSNLPHPYYDKKIRRKIKTTVIETSRGCPNDCDFCGVSEFYGRRYRIKTIDYVIEELKRTKDIGKAIFFTDDNLVVNPTHSIKLFNEIAKEGLNKKFGVCQVTIKIADNPEVLKALKRAGIRTLCIGVESIDAKSLKFLGKPYSSDQNILAIKKLKKEGFWIHGMLIPGGDEDDIKTLENLSRFTQKYLDSVQYFPINPIPGTKLTKKMEAEKRILRKTYSLYDGDHVLVRPKNFEPYELQKIIYKMYEDFYSVKSFLRRLIIFPNKRVTLFLLFYTKFTGIRKILYDPNSKEHLRFLKNMNS